MCKSIGIIISSSVRQIFSFTSVIAASVTVYLLISIAVIIAQAGLVTIPRIGSYMPGKLLGWGNNLLSGNGDSYWWALAITVAVISLCVYFARQLLRNRDL